MPSCHISSSIFHSRDEYVENGLEGYHVAIVHDVLNDFVDTKGAKHFLEEHSSYTHALIKQDYQGLVPPPPHVSAEEATYVRFGMVFPNLIPVITPGDFSYLRIDPVAPGRIRLIGRSFDLGGQYAGEYRAFRREAFLRLPYFDHIHRYIPALMLREGYKVAFLPVNHRHRQTGQSKYTNLGRLWASLSDLLGVMWLQSRARNPGGADEV